MIAEFPPGLLLIGGAILVPFIKGNLRSFYMLALPLLGIWQLTALDPGSFGSISVFGFEQTLVHVDKLSRLFGYIFYISSTLGIVFAWHRDDWVEQATALVYVGAAIGAVFAGDLITLFVFWELTAVASVFLIWAARTGAGLPRRFPMSDHLYLVGHPAAGGRGHARRGNRLGHLRQHRSGQPWRRAHTARLWHKVRLPAAAQLAAGCLSGSLGNRHGFPQRLYHEAGCLRSGARLCGDRRADLDRRDHDRLSHILRGDRERSAPGSGLQPQQPAGFHGGGNRHRDHACHQRGGQPRLCPHHL